MKPKKIRLLANLILWIGTIVCLCGCVFALLLAQGNPMGIPTDYVPDYVDFICDGAALLGVIVVAIILHVVADRKEKRDKIRACWAVDEKPADDAVAAEEMPAIVDVDEDLLDAAEDVKAEAAEETPAGKTTKEPKENKLLKLRAKVAEKTPLSEKQVTIVGAAALAAIPVALIGIVLGKKNAKLKAYRKKEKRRKELYEWLG